MTEEPSREQQLRTRVITTPIETMVRMMIISAQDGQDDDHISTQDVQDDVQDDGQDDGYICSGWSG